MKTVQFWVAVAVVGFMFLPVAALAQRDGGAETLVPVREQTPEGIPYLSGGVGLEEREDFKAIDKEYNTKLIFALKEGKYLALINVVVQDAKGKTVLQTSTQGPWLLVQLPTGTYTVRATMRIETITREIKVEEGKRTEVSFLW